MTKIKILLNGESREVPENLSIKELFTFLDLSEKHCAVEINKEIIFIVGDGGAWESKPRFVCKKKNNLTFIVNGLGDLPGDSILVLYENKIYKYQLN